MPRRNENVRYMEDQEIEGDFEQPINQIITFNRQSEFITENGNNKKETRVKEINRIWFHKWSSIHNNQRHGS